MSRHEAALKLNNLYDKRVAEIKTVIVKIKYICTTADIWTSSKRRFLGVTAHWVRFINIFRNTIYTTFV